MTSSNLAALNNKFDRTDDEKFLEWYTNMFEKYPNMFMVYLSQDVVLQWFGRNIYGRDRIYSFIKSLVGTKHVLDPVVQNKPSTEYYKNKSSAPPSYINNIPQEDDDMVLTIDEEVGQGDCTFPEHKLVSHNTITYGAIEFVRPHWKQGILKTKLKRPCKLQIIYEHNLTKPIKFTIQFMIYTDNNSAFNKNLTKGINH